MRDFRNQAAADLAWVNLELDHGSESGFVDAQLLPGRGLMLAQARARLAGGRLVQVLFAPGPDEVARALNGGPQDFMGNASYAFGAAVLAPFANRIRGIHSAADRTIETCIHGHRLRLPANGGGKASGAEQYAIHGLILAEPVIDLRTERGRGYARAWGVIRAGDFGVGWPSSTELEIEWSLRAEALSLRVLARNAGAVQTPIGLGWHPYFAIPSGRRDQARMRVPGRSRLAVNNYDEVLPTGAITPVVGTAYDFRAAGGRSLGNQYLDDCFVELDRTPAGETVCEVIDPAAQYGLRIISSSPQVSAVQTFTAPGKPFVVIEPQFNWANPYGAEWPPGQATGMVLLEPGQAVSYDVTLELFVPSAIG